MANLKQPHISFGSVYFGIGILFRDSFETGLVILFGILKEFGL